ncbi:MAG: YkgJ family cysteine cluster protein [Methanotrichaceae archaeon]|nr:YkgJ family cysteine cluster protein [Methanotrichaceae archaeon]
MDEFMRAEIDGTIRVMQALSNLVPEGGLKNLEKAREEMDEMISPEFEPYFSANAGLHLLAECKRCGWCCRNVAVAVSIDDCRRIARHLGLSLKRFMMDYTSSHELKGDRVGNARMMKKVDGSFCAFFDSSLPGCRIHSVKPQVCTAALYLAKMNLLLCEEHGKLSTFAYCPADVQLRARIADFALRLNGDAEAKSELERLFMSTRPEVELFRLLLRLKGMEIYFGPDRAAVIARRLGLKKVPEDEELMQAAFLYAVSYFG